MLHLKTSTVDLTWLRVTRDGEVHALTETEGTLLRYLVAHAGRDVDRGELEAAVGRTSGTTRAIDIAVARLRAKLGEADQPYHIRTVRGVGYRFVDGTEPAPSVSAPSAGRRPLQIATGRVDLDRREFVDGSGQSHALGKMDVDLLERLATGAAVPRDDVVRAIWGRGQHGRSLTAALRRLRLRLGDDPLEPAIVLSLPGATLRLARVDADLSTRTNLRPQRTPFVERPEVDQLLGLLTQPTDRALITIRGPAGIGKTRLLYEVGLRLVDGTPDVEVWFCDLTCALAEQGILRAIETALGIDQGPAADSAVRIGRVLARKPRGTVLILDNFDQVSRHTAALEEAIRQAPNVRFVVTSRHALGLPSERCVDVGPLEVSAAARLFVDRAPTADGLDPASPSVRTLVQRLDCLPLAVELAAARAGEFTVEDLLSRLGDRLNWLVRPPLDAVSPHRSLRGALDWSWDLLGEDARRALAQCAVFARSFSLPLARDVLDVREADLALQQLTERSLLDRGEGSWRLYEGIRDYAREKLLLLGAWDQTVQRHAEVCVRRANAAIARLRGTGELAALAELRALRDDLLAVPTRTVSMAVAAQAAIALVPMLQIDGPRVLIDALCTAALSHDHRSEEAWRLWLALGERSRLSGRWAEADERFGQALAAAERVDDLARAQVLRERSFAWVDSGRFADAEPVLREVLAVFRRSGEEAEAVDVERYLAKGLVRERPEEAAAQLESVRLRLLQIGDPLRLYHLHRDLAALHVARGELDLAEECVVASMGWARDLNLRRGEYDGLWWLALLARQRGDLSRADHLLVDARHGYESLGEDERARLMVRLRALGWVEAGRFDAAEQSLSAAYHEATEGDLYRAIDLANLAVVWHLQDRREAAIQAFLRLVDQVPAGPMRTAMLHHLAAAFADDDRLEDATARLAEADAIDPSGPLREVCAAVVALASARSGSVDRASTTAAARGMLERFRGSGPKGAPGLARRDQDLNIACCVLERAIERTAGPLLRGETTGSHRVRPRRRR